MRQSAEVDLIGSCLFITFQLFSPSAFISLDFLPTCVGRNDLHKHTDCKETRNEIIMLHLFAFRESDLVMHIDGLIGYTREGHIHTNETYIPFLRRTYIIELSLNRPRSIGVLPGLSSRTPLSGWEREV